LIESVYFFSKIKKEHRRLAGGKGNTLAYLYQKNYPVPNGFVIMPSAFQHDEISPEAWKQVQMHLRQLRKTNAGTSFAVRSSALGEDSITASFAGQFETILRVHTDEEVRQSIQVQLQPSPYTCLRFRSTYMREHPGQLLRMFFVP